MTTILINHEDGASQLMAYGHSGYAPQGSDIVCAAISTLTQTFAMQIPEETKLTRLVCENDVIEITYEDNEKTEAMLRMVEKGLESLKEQYPEYIEIIKANKII